MNRHHPDRDDRSHPTPLHGPVGNSYKVALMLELAGADWEPIWNDYFNGATRDPACKSMNTMASVATQNPPGLIAASDFSGGSRLRGRHA